MSLTGLSLSWEVLADAPGVMKAAGASAGAGVERAVVRMTLLERGVELLLEWTRAGGTRAERVSLGVFDTPVHLSGDSARGARLVHLSVPGVLQASVLIDARADVRVWYARTPLLAGLGFPAGSYDRPAAGWTS